MAILLIIPFLVIVSAQVCKKINFAPGFHWHIDNIFSNGITSSRWLPNLDMPIIIRPEINEDFIQIRVTNSNYELKVKDFALILERKFQSLKFWFEFYKSPILYTL